MLKQPATYAVQIAKLREHGCVVSDEAFCEGVLSHIGYYRLSAYFLTFKTKDGQYKSGTDFNAVYKLYEFDRKMRRLLFSVIEELEIYLRAQLSYYHAHKYGADGYLNPANFNSRHNHLSFAAHINDLVNSNSKAAFVKHHLTKYGGQFPLWVITELFTFGMLSYFYADMITADQKRLARDVFRASVPNVKSWLYCLTVLRNVCAHNNRLYFTIFSAVPPNLPHIDKSVENRLFASVMALRQLYPDAEKWNNEFLPAMSALFEEYKSVIFLKHIGYPEDWETVMRK
jgi:abortive infection bacteriophage resistance protein